MNCKLIIGLIILNNELCRFMLGLDENDLKELVMYKVG